MSIHLIPQPQRITICNESIAFSPKQLHAVLRMPVCDERLVRPIQAMFGELEVQTNGKYTEFSLCAGENATASCEPPQQREGYSLTTAAQAVCIRAYSAQGLFYGLQTLNQLLCNKHFPAVEITDWPDLALRSDYLDLRSIYPTFARLLEFIREMAAYKFNTLVIEYEDKLPFETLAELRHPAAFTPQQFQTMLATAQENFMEVIPLQQSFGHLEYVLKHPKYKYLRETPDTPGEMCPLRKGSFELAATLLEETARLHPNSRYLHIGCDEVWSLGSSEECRHSGKSREQISVEYVNRLVAHVCTLGKTPIVWHDMLENAPQEVLDQLDKRAVVAVWEYSDRVVRHTVPPLLERLRYAGVSYFVCSATRSYDSLPWQNYPCAQTRLRNIDAWCELAQSQQITGIINTNWASSFSLGRPYGLFETSRYTAFYAADRNWNLSALTDTYLERFLSLYHGIFDIELYGGTYNNFDYYCVLPHMLHQVTRNKLTAQLITLCVQYEGANPVICNTFRGALFPADEVELDCLRERAVKNYAYLDKISKELEQLVNQLLPQEMSTLFIASRTYQNQLYRKELEKMLDIQL